MPPWLRREEERGEWKEELGREGEQIASQRILQACFPDERSILSSAHRQWEEHTSVVCFIFLDIHIYWKKKEAEHTQKV